MDPVVAIVWIGVAVFAATSVLAVLYLAGFVPSLRQEYGRHLFRILVAEIVVASVAVFTFFIQDAVHRDTKNRIPVNDMMVIEQSDSPRIVYDGELAIHVRSSDVSRDKRLANLLVDTRPDFSTAVPFVLEPGSPKEVSMPASARKYRFSYARMGTIDADPKELRGKDWDFIMLSIEKAK